MLSVVASRWRAPALFLLAVVMSRQAPALAAAEAAAVLAVPPSKSALLVAIDLPKDTAGHPDSSEFWVFRDDRAKDVKFPAQAGPAIAEDGTVASPRGRVMAVIPPDAARNAVHRFRGKAVPAPSGGDAVFAFSEGEKSLKLSEGGMPVLVYNHGVITGEKVPPNDKRRSRSCYIHPLWGLGGEVLTDDFPKDHYHHHGVFWAWPHVKIDGKEYDLWMYNNITPRFVRWLGRETGPVAAVLGVENGWFVGDRKVMIERVWLTAYKAAPGQRAIDLDFTWIPVDRPITLRGAEGKSYGGLNVRFAVKKEKDAAITVPSGRTKSDLPDTPLPWADLSAPFRGPNAQPSGAAIFVPASHPDYPPTWLTRHYGPLCIGWPGVKEKTFEPGKPIRLGYRMWIHKEPVEVDQLKQEYEAYKAGANVKWE